MNIEYEHNQKRNKLCRVQILKKKKKNDKYSGYLIINDLVNYKKIALR